MSGRRDGARGSDLLPRCNVEGADEEGEGAWSGGEKYPEEKSGGAERLVAD
eukprot:ctg_4569.g631